MVRKGRDRRIGTNMSRTIRFFPMYYVSSRILENLPFEIYSHLIEKKAKRQNIFYSVYFSLNYLLQRSLT